MAPHGIQVQRHDRQSHEQRYIHLQMHDRAPPVPYLPKSPMALLLLVQAPRIPW